MYCISFCIGQELNLTLLERFLKQEHKCRAVRHKGVLEVELADDGLLFYFGNGTLISWRLKRYQCAVWLERALPFSTNALPVDSIIKDEFSFQVGGKTSVKPHDFFDIDCLVLEEDSNEVKLGISYGLSQSIKLNYYEQRLERLIAKSKPMMKTIKNNSFKKISMRQLQQAISEQLIEKSELNLTSNFLYQPSFLWQHPSLEPLFLLIEEYMDIEKRISALNKRLDTLNEIHDVILNYNQTMHSSRLEVIIIVLIMLEIIFYILNLHF